jgi:Chaperone of endosialidase
MASIRVSLTLVLALMLGLAVPVTAQPLSGPEYIPLMPCRVFDSRTVSPLPGGEPTNITIAGLCGVPPNAVAADLNFTIVNPQGVGHLTVFPANGPAPLASLVNYVPGQTVANVADIRLGAGGAVSAQPFTTTELVVDVYGYFIDVEELADQNTALGDGALANITRGIRNTATGVNALASNTTGGGNVATGFQALNSNTSGDNNTATGPRALFSNTTGVSNTATGAGALFSNTTGEENTALGDGALSSNTTGLGNTAVGFTALVGNTTGNLNIALGTGAGFNVTTGSNNIHIYDAGTDADNALIRIGTAGTQTATFIAGINGVNIGMGAPVLVNANGQLGTMMSAAGFKEGIEDLGEGSRRLLGLRPVRFRYKPQHDDPSRPLQYGLVAEEVAEVFPELVYPGPDGAPSSVSYHLLSVLLLNELQRQEREWRAEKAKAAARFEAQQAQLDELRAQVRALIGGRAAVRE